MDKKFPISDQESGIPGPNTYGAIPDTGSEKKTKEDDTFEDSSVKLQQKNCGFILSATFLALLLAGLLAALIAVIVMETVEPATPTTPGNGTGSPESSAVRLSRMELSRIDCYPETVGGVDILTPEKCAARGCVYQESATPGVPWCFVPQTDFGFSVTDGPIATPLGERWLLTRKNILGVYADNFENVTFDVEMRDNNMLRFKFETPEDPDRYQIPWPLSLSEERAPDPVYQLEVYQQDPFSFRIIRISNGAVIWDTGVGGLVFSDKFLQIATALPSSSVYGFGENVHESFKHDLNFRSWPIWARDDPPAIGKNAYSSYPFYECIEADGQAHGALLWNSNAMDYTFTPNPMLVYKTIGGILDFYIFMGPSPENVIQQYTGVVGRPLIPPYWSLGFQISRYGYKNTSDMRGALERTQAYNIPVDLQYADIDHMDRQRSFTLDHENFTDLPEYTAELRAQGMRTVLIVNPTVEIAEDYTTYLRGREADVFTVFESVEVMPPGDYDLYNRTDVMGTVWPEWIITFVDYFKTVTRDFWTTELRDLNQLIPFDGIWLDMNEPGNFDTNRDKAWNWPDDRVLNYTLKCPVTEWDDPPYRTQASIIYDIPEDEHLERLSFKTICMQNIHGDGGQYRHYDIHNVYGHVQTNLTWNALLDIKGSDKRPMIISRSMFAGDGQYGGRWLGDNSASWQDLRLSVIGILESNLFGVPYIGADICGFFGNSTASLCKRWHQLGAFYPYSRNHNHELPLNQDPGYFGDEVGIPTREIYLERYRLLPYLYTLFYRASADGNTVVRPLMHEFTTDAATLDIDNQFLWGPALLVTPIMEEDATVLSYFLPAGRWYNYWDVTSVTDSGGVMVAEPVTDTSPPVIHIRGGYILPTQEPDSTTTSSRLNPFGLKVALDVVDGSAVGELFWDDGETLDTVGKGFYNLASFDCSSNSLSMTIENLYSAVVSGLQMGTVDVYGVSVANFVYVNGGLHASFTFDDVNQVLSISNLGLPMDSDFTIEWMANEAPLK